MLVFFTSLLVLRIFLEWVLRTGEAKMWAWGFLKNSLMEISGEMFGIDFFLAGEAGIDFVAMCLRWFLNFG